MGRLVTRCAGKVLVWGRHLLAYVAGNVDFEPKYDRGGICSPIQWDSRQQPFVTLQGAGGTWQWCHPGDIDFAGELI